MKKPARLSVGVILLTILFQARGAGAAEPAPVPRQYAPYAFLIGAWDVAPDGGPPIGVARFRWGPNGAYIWYSQSLLEDGAERPHFEGVLVWNGVRRKLDMLLSVDLDRGLVAESGTLGIQPDGTLVREITAIYSEGAGAMGGKPAGPEGATARFRQTFRREAPDRIATRVLRASGKGWVATFPGSDRLVMTRRAAG